jgi:AraC-like DNA-binding protein
MTADKDGPNAARLAVARRAVLRVRSSRGKWEAASATADRRRDEFEDAIRAANAAGVSLRDLAQDAGIKRSALSRIVRGERGAR